MFSVNKVELEGTACTGVELHSYSNGAGQFASFYLRVDGYGPTAKPQYFEVTVWNDSLIQKAQNSIQRDVPVRIEGSIVSRSYQKRDGSKALNYSIKAFSITTDEAPKAPLEQNVQHQATPAGNSFPSVGTTPEPVITDDMLPF